jgi:hypothetical protein
VGAVAAARIGWAEVRCFSARIAEVSEDIGQGKIADCRGCLARFRLNEWGIVWGKY